MAHLHAIRFCTAFSHGLFSLSQIVLVLMPMVERSFQSANQLFYDSATTAAVGPLEVSQEDDEGEFNHCDDGDIYGGV